MNSSNVKVNLHPRICGTMTMDQKLLPSHKPKIVAPILTNKVSFYPKSRSESNNHLKCQNFHLWSFAPKNQFWLNRAQKTHQAVIPEPQFKFSHIRSHFIRNEVNSMNLLNFKKQTKKQKKKTHTHFHIEVWGLKTNLDLMGPEDLPSCNCNLTFPKHGLILSRTKR